jgi:hypothetical protein
MSTPEEQQDSERSENFQKRAEPKEPPVDGPGTGSTGEDDESDLADTSYDRPTES